MFNRDMVREFHKKHGFPLDQSVLSTVDKCSLETIRSDLAHLAGVMEPVKCLAVYRMHLIMEEAAELAEGLSEGDLEQTADAIADLLYVVIGTADTYGLPWMELLTEVHSSNMSKQVRTPDNARMRDKGPNYFPPDILGVIRRGRTSMHGDEMHPYTLHSPDSHFSYHRLHGAKLLGPLILPENGWAEYIIVDQSWPEKIRLPRSLVTQGWDNVRRTH